MLGLAAARLKSAPRKAGAQTPGVWKKCNKVAKIIQIINLENQNIGRILAVQTTNNMKIVTIANAKWADGSKGWYMNVGHKTVKIQAKLAKELLKGVEYKEQLIISENMMTYTKLYKIK